MRNLEQYPITTDEIVQCLKELMDGVSYEKTGLVGDMRPLLLANAIQLISASASAQCAPSRDEMVERAKAAAWKLDLPLTEEEIRAILSAVTSTSGVAAAQRPLEDIRKALFEPEESNAYDNLEGALIDIERFSEQGKPTDAVCIRTIRRVLTQLHTVHSVIHYR